MANKMTKREYFTILANTIKGIEMENKEEILAFIEHEIELLNKKHSKSGNSKTQKENIAIMETIVSALETVGRPVTITELQKEVESMSEYSNQKLSALLKKLVAEVRVVISTDKKKSYFSIV